MRPRTLCRLVIAALSLDAGCTSTLPDQDRRIYAAVPVAKMSAADLWSDFHRNQPDATKKYLGKAIEVSGSVTGLSRDKPASSLFFKQDHDLGVRANLLDDEAAQILASLGEGQRITLRCFCAGLSGNVILKSCVRR